MGLCLLASLGQKAQSEVQTKMGQQKCAWQPERRTSCIWAPTFWAAFLSAAASQSALWKAWRRIGGKFNTINSGKSRNIRLNLHPGKLLVCLLGGPVNSLARPSISTHRSRGESERARERAEGERKGSLEWWRSLPLTTKLAQFPPKIHSRSRLA